MAARRFGRILGSMPSRNQLPRPVATFNILMNFYRRLFIAAVILFFFDTPVLQLELTLLINLLYACFTVGAKGIEDPNERREEIFN